MSDTPTPRTTEALRKAAQYLDPKLAVIEMTACCNALERELAAERDILEEVLSALNAAGCPTGNEYKTYSIVERIAGLHKTRDYAWKQMDEGRVKLAEERTTSDFLANAIEGTMPPEQAINRYNKSLAEGARGIVATTVFQKLAAEREAREKAEVAALQVGDQWRTQLQRAEQAEAKLTSAIGLLSVAGCPCPNCDGSGAYQISETEIHQCQWCAERKSLIT